MKINQYIVILAVIIAPFDNAAAQVRVTLEECRKDALEYNKSMDLSRMDLEYANAAIKAARTAYYPKVDGSGSAMYLPDFEGVSLHRFTLPTTEEAMAGQFSGTSGVDFPGFDLGMSDLQIYMAGIDAEQVIYAGGRIRMANQIAERGADIAREALNLTRAEVKHGVDRTFWNLYAIQQQVEVIENHKNALSTLEELLRKQHELGITSRSEMLMVSVKRTEANLQLVEIRNLLNLTSMNLARLTGRPLDEPLSAFVSNDDESETFPELIIPVNFSNRAEIQILNQQKEIARLERLSVRSEYLPQFGLNMGYRYVHIPDLMSGSWNMTIGAGVSIPIIHWRERKHRTDMARISEMQSEIKLNDTQDQIALEVHQSRQNLEAGYDRLKMALLNQEQAKETLSEVEISYHAGLNDITDLLNARVGYQRAEAMLVEAKANLEILKSAYLKSVGLL